jgi:ATP-dependent protease HslVU (ClpYQ) peptidase subunit
LTIIAWDGTTLAADKRGTNYGYPTTTTKIHRVPGGLVGFSGCGAHAAELLEWFKAGRPADKYPKTTEDRSAGSMFITEDCSILQYTYDNEHPETIEDKFYARGSGRDYALAAMHLGHDARRAVEVACALDTSCGNGIDTLELQSQTGVSRNRKVLTQRGYIGRDLIPGEGF